MIRATSTTGWVFAGLYGIAAAVLFYRASACTGWVCDLVALPAVVPSGFVVGPLLEWLDSVYLFPGYSPSAALRSPYFIVPTVLGNLVFFYGLGALAARGAKRLRSLLDERGQA